MGVKWTPLCNNDGIKNSNRPLRALIFKVIYRNESKR